MKLWQPLSSQYAICQRFGTVWFRECECSCSYLIFESLDGLFVIHVHQQQEEVGLWIDESAVLRVSVPRYSIRRSDANANEVRVESN